VKGQGWTVLARDWRARTGQIDIVAEDGETLVLVEVKARRGTGFGLPEEAVDARKQQKLRALMETYRMATKRQRQQCRIDVLGPIPDEAAAAAVPHRRARSHPRRAAASDALRAHPQRRGRELSGAGCGACRPQLMLKGAEVAAG